MMQRVLLAILVSATACTASDPLDIDGDGDECWFEDCQDGPTPPPQPAPRFIAESDVSMSAPTFSRLATHGHQRWTFRSVDPVDGTPAVSIKNWQTGDKAATVSVLSSDATSVTVDVSAGVAGPFELVVSSPRGRQTFSSEARDVADVVFALPDTRVTQSIRKYLQGESELVVVLCPDACKFGNPRLVDSAMSVSGTLTSTAWDRVALPSLPGSYSITVDSTAFAQVSQAIEVVSAADDIGVEQFNPSSGDVYSKDGTLCFYGLHAGERVMARTWNVTSPTLGMQPVAGASNCITYQGSPGRSYVITIQGAGVTRDFAFTVSG